jgi:ATP-dependent DNA helicase RecQ
LAQPPRMPVPPAAREAQFMSMGQHDHASTHLDLVLGRLSGPDATARTDQLDAVAAVLEPRARVLVVQATGWGKSAVYWAATSALRAHGAGPTLVVSPLLALMRDQADAAQRAGLRAATMNSTNLDHWDEIFTQLDANQLDVLLVSPERLANPRFAATLGTLLATVGLIVIDEAHCVSDWGFDFRPDYQRLTRMLLGAPDAAVLATTATANERVTTDIAAQLGPRTRTFRGTLARTSLRLSVVPGLSPLERYAWVADALDTLSGSGIVYVLTVAEAERLTGFLQACGHNVDSYTGGLSADQRIIIEQRLRRNEVRAVVATSALGMGYDKPDLGFCIHVGSPATPVAYYQQVGRAGRGVASAEAVLLPGPGDERIWDYFATATIPNEAQAHKVLEQLETGPASVAQLEAATGMRRGRLDALLKILAVDGAVERDGTAWARTGVAYQHDHQRWAGLARVRGAEADLMRRYAAGDGCLMAFLQQSLDDPEPGPCGRCSVCTGELPAPGNRPSVARIDAARRQLRGVEIIVEARKLWPSGVSRRGRIVGAEPGRAVAFGDDAAWGDELAELHAEPPTLAGELAAGTLDALRRWKPHWPGRPGSIVVAPSPDMRASRLLAAHLAQIGNLPLLDVFSWHGLPAPGDVASAAKVTHLEQAIILRDQTQLPAGPVLLVGATMRSGWTMTVAAALLREAGASAVLPLVAHRLP